MEILNNYTVVVNNSDELKTALEENNGYNYIYFGSDISLTSKITINENKKKLTIDGTYLNIKHTYTVSGSIDKTDIITAGADNEHIIVKNIVIANICKYGVIYVPQDKNCCNVLTEYQNVKFSGIEMIFNPYGKAKIIDCDITIERTSGIDGQEACEADIVEIGGNTTIYSSSSNFTLFYYISDAPNPTLRFLQNSNITLTSVNKELMVGVSNLDFQILHDTKLNLITASGFATNSNQGVQNVLIDERATFNFTETSHRSVPMWAIFGNFTMNEGSNLNLMNNYISAPIDNYSMYFKGNNQKITLNNSNITIYNKIANTIYSDNEVEFDFKISRINMWTDSYDLTIAGTINNLPDYYWYKENDLLEIKGNFNNNSTTIINHNLTEKELTNLPDLNNFSFQNKKQLSIGTSRINIYPINQNTTTIKGYTLPTSDVLIKYNDVNTIVQADDDGLFELNNSVPDNTTIEIVANISGSFIYKRIKKTTPFTGELTIMDASTKILFELNPITPIILPKTEAIFLKIIDTRENKNGFKLFSKVTNDLISENNFKLKDSLIFKKFDDNIINLSTEPILVYEQSSSTDINSITFSKEKGPLLDITNNALEINEEYKTKIIWEVS